MKVSVLAFDLSDNSTGRADLLARLLASRYAVEVVGPRFGAEVWRPARDGAIGYRARAAARYPAFAAPAAALARLADGDVLFASKPRPTSFGIALLARRQRRRPLILDVDDWELGFFCRSGAWGRLGRARREARIPRARPRPVRNGAAARGRPDLGPEARPHHLHLEVGRQQPGEKISAARRVVGQVEGEDGDLHAARRE